MKKFILLYSGVAPSYEEMSPKQRKTKTAEWREWSDRVGKNLEDPGYPLGKGLAVFDDGTHRPPSQINGYSIISASDLDEAKEIVAGNPVLSDRTGQFSVEIHELLPIHAD